MMVRSVPVAVLFAVASRSSAAYVGGDLGYGGQSSCVPGYDTDCNGPAPYPAPQPAPSPSPTPYQTNAVTSAPDQVVSTAKPDCKLQIPQDCRFPFVYKGLSYTTCTGVDAVNTLWCSTERNYTGHWRQCTDPCKNKLPVRAIASTVVAGSVAATGLGLIAAAMHNQAQNAATTAAPAGATTTAAPAAVGTSVMAKEWVLQAPNGPGGVGVMEQSIAVPAPAPGRRMNEGRFLQGTTIVPVEVQVPVQVVVGGPGQPMQKLAAAAATTTMGPTEANQHFGLLILGCMLIVCCCGCICSIGVAHYAGFGKKRVKRGTPQENQAGYPQAYDYPSNE